MLEEASSWYNALQIRFQKRTTHHISFEGSYTISKATDDSSAGRNNWVGALGNGIPQQLDRLYREHSIGGNDTPQRLAAAVVVDLPIGRKQWIGGNMNRAVDAVVGGWSLATIITEQAGQPMALAMSNARLANGTQRPEVVCSQFKTGTSVHCCRLDLAECESRPLSQRQLFCRSRRPGSRQCATVFFRPAHRRHPQHGSEYLQVVRAQRRHADRSAGGDI